jgi:hypothetical protein
MMGPAPIQGDAFVFGSLDAMRVVNIQSSSCWAERSDLSERLDLRTGLRVWKNAANAMGQLLTLHSVLYDGKAVLELGCGVASSSAVLSDKAGLALATDGAAGVLKLAKRNLFTNTAPRLSNDRLEADRKAAVLRWGVPDDIARAKSIVTEWRVSSSPASGSDGCFDLVIGSDCLFPRPLDTEMTIFSQAKALFQTAKELLSKDGLFITTFQARVKGMNRQLRQAAEQVGFAIVFVHRNCVTEKDGPCKPATTTATTSPEEVSGAAAGVEYFDPKDPMLQFVRIATLAHGRGTLDAVMVREGFELADPAEDEDDVPPPAHETLAGGLFADDDE